MIRKFITLCLILCVCAAAAVHSLRGEEKICAEADSRCSFASSNDGTINEKTFGLHFSLASEKLVSSYIIESYGEGYLARSDCFELEDSSLSSLISMIEFDGAVIRFGGILCDENLNFTKSVILCGDIYMQNANLNLSGAETHLEDFTFNSEGGSIGIKSGRCKARSAKVYSKGASAFVLDGVSGASLVIDGADITADSSVGAVVCSRGTVSVKSGKIVNKYAPAIVNSGTLYLSGSPLISGFSFDAVTDNPIYLSENGEYLSSAVSVIYKQKFEKGSFNIVFRNADRESASLVTLFDETAEKTEHVFFEECSYTDEDNVSAVYIPNAAKFYLGNSLYATAEFLDGDVPRQPDNPQKNGYSFVGWYKDTAYSEPYVFSAENDDIALYASFSLNAPEFSIFSKSFVYDGKNHLFGFDKISHSLSAEGSYSFVWYKNGEELSCSSSTLNLSAVGDSGEYYCKLTFAYCGDFVTVETPKITVTIEKRIIYKPDKTTEYYSGYPISPAIFDTEYYTVAQSTFTDAGVYSITLTLSDADNNMWSDSDSDTTTAYFEILKSENEFSDGVRVENIYEGEELIVSVVSRFGIPVLSYSSDGENWSEEKPSLPGVYFVTAAVAETENYYYLVSYPVRFEICEEICIGIKIDKYPDKTDYKAFETLLLDGAEFTVTYNSGRQEKIDSSRVLVDYGGKEYFLASDSSVTVVFEEASVPLGVKISLAEYDITGIKFEDKTAVYNGQRHTVDINFEVVGKDGIPLGFKIRGGGINAGKYEVTLVFESESANYALPSPMTAELVVLPMPLEVKYGNLEFVYDGSAKIPSATVINAQGLQLTLTLSGAAVNAGKYSALATISDSNYTLKNPKIDFEILKADFDLSGIRWSAESFIYNGKEHSVTVSGLPCGMELIGYANSMFTEAGEYLTEITVGFDSRNFNPPEKITHKWRIEPSEYDFSLFGFIDSEYVYDGKAHYPKSFGNLPIGLDGSSPEYTFSSSVTNANEGNKKITVSFTTGSKNYRTPEDIEVYVKILPKEVIVEWDNLAVVYNGLPQSPTAQSSECAVRVVINATDAGEYTAVAVTDDANYLIVNPKAEFFILKAENYWIESASVPTVYEGRIPEPYSKAYFGDAEYLYYSDKELKNRVYEPKTQGEYYVVAYVPESQNYISLISEALKFNIYEILPVELKVDFAAAELIATLDIREQGIRAYLLNNDGSLTPVDIESLEVSYENGRGLLAADKKIGFSYGGFFSEYEISVSRCPVSVPEIPAVVYNGNVRIPEFEENAPYSTDFRGASESGVYTVKFYLKDAANYEFKNGISEASFEIKKAPLTLEVGKKGNSYSVISGEVYGDSLMEEYYTENGFTYIKVNNPNYDVSVIAAESKEGAKYVRIVFLVALIIVLVTLLTYISFMERKRILHFALGVIEKISNMRAGKESVSAEALHITGQTSEERELERLMAVDEPHANHLISDSLAKSLIAEYDGAVKTEGKRRCIVNIDTISGAFAPGDTVDINAMKEKGIIPSDARSVKVLARGIIDKPLHVIANSFSLPAVKMIALTGGSVRRSRSR